MATNYPKWLYHPTKPAVVVEDEEGHRALGPEWVASPADFHRPVEPKKQPEATAEQEAPEITHYPPEKHYKKSK